MLAGEGMMRKFIVFAGVAATALVLAQGSGMGQLSNFAKALNSAETLSAKYTVQRIGAGAPSSFSVNLAKPNLARIERPNEIIVADGTHIITYDKAKKTYWKRPQTDADLAGLFADDDVALWAAFFNPRVYDRVPSARATGTKNRRGMSLSVIEVALDAQNRKSMAFYLDRSNVARQAEITYSDQDGILLIDAREIALGDNANAEMFAWKAPEGARELTQEELDYGRWYTDLDEALAVAKRTNRAVMIDFGAVW
jgi:outer membrane lipoprotein-sorting protein